MNAHLKHIHRRIFLFYYNMSPFTYKLREGFRQHEEVKDEFY